MTDFLDRVVRERRADVAAAKAWRPLEQMKRAARLERIRQGNRSLVKDIRDRRRAGKLAVIAEVKRVSPALGPLATGLDPASLAQRYQEAGAAGISVLAESRHWGGSLEDVRAASKAVMRFSSDPAGTEWRYLPLAVLAKDVIVDEYQVAEAGAAGAHAVLLIAEALAERQLAECIGVALEIGLDVLVEAHDPVAFDGALRVVDAFARGPLHPDATERIALGVNARDLREPSKIDRRRIHELAGRVPEEFVLVAESGIASVRDAEDLPLRVDAVLVGTALVRADDPSPLIRALADVRPARSLA